jgi:hypothetical protein
MTTATVAPTLPIAPVLCSGGTVVCLATGPSLTAADAEYCRGKATVIAVNDAWTLAPWADVLYSSDQYWYPHHKWVPSFAGIKVAMSVKHPGVITLKRSGDAGIDWSPHALRAAKNSGGAAINLAVHIAGGKPSKIVLVGYDMGATGEGHFFGRHPQGLRHTRKDTYETFRMLIGTMVAPLRARGIDVVNASRKSALTCFPRVPLEEALP